MKNLLIGSLLVITSTAFAIESLDILKIENECFNGMPRIESSIELTQNVMTLEAVGVSHNGDIAVIKNIDGKSILHVSACSDSQMRGQQITLTSNPIVSPSALCSVDQVVQLNLNIGNKPLSFTSIEGEGSSLCATKDQSNIENRDKQVKFGNGLLYQPGKHTEEVEYACPDGSCAVVIE